MSCFVSNAKRRTPPQIGARSCRLAAVVSCAPRTTTIWNRPRCREQATVVRLRRQRAAIVTRGSRRMQLAATTGQPRSPAVVAPDCHRDWAAATVSAARRMTLSSLAQSHRGDQRISQDPGTRGSPGQPARQASPLRILPAGLGVDASHPTAGWIPDPSVGKARRNPVARAGAEDRRRSLQLPTAKRATARPGCRTCNNGRRSER